MNPSRRGAVIGLTVIVGELVFVVVLAVMATSSQ